MPGRAEGGERHPQTLNFVSNKTENFFLHAPKPMPTIHPRPTCTVSRDSADEGAGSVSIHPERAGGGWCYRDGRPKCCNPIPFKVR